MAILGVLNLGNNSLSGRIEGTFPRNCGLNTLDLHGNFLEGKIHESLVNCTMLEVINLGKNKINDTYPCSLNNNTNLRVFVLRSNWLHGSVVCGQTQHNKWSKLQILDISSNHLNGEIPSNWFRQWVSITYKGVEVELVRILKIFTSIDISNNQFSGEIPRAIGQLKVLHVLNVSHNEFTGSIPPSMGDLSQLESLDMSSNKLSGKIPDASLTFLAKFNLSYNQLKGRIPTSNQFLTFENDSYLGNKELCGVPLKRACTTSIVPVYALNSKESNDEKVWQSILYGMGVGAGSLIVISVLYILWKEFSGIRRQTPRA
ncbi:putative leucine-rich repeat domain superfamily [Helianthus annuus]|nr:putative leucine-rich repeat domain superfamily [Helianthus annuus]KAJ0882885.1 putative leucine-rich repeat domain superfamily [Helianthus annuus]